MILFQIYQTISLYFSIGDILLFMPYCLEVSGSVEPVRLPRSAESQLPGVRAEIFLVKLFHQC